VCGSESGWSGVAKGREFDLRRRAESECVLSFLGETQTHFVCEWFSRPLSRRVGRTCAWSCWLLLSLMHRRLLTRGVAHLLKPICIKHISVPQLHTLCSDNEAWLKRHAQQRLISRIAQWKMSLRIMGLVNYLVRGHYRL
jgi:hypothetical protein